MKKTRLIAGLLALMTACSLCACGNDASSENAAESAVQESAAETTAPAEDEEEASESEADYDSNDAGTEESSINTVIQSSADYQPEDPASDEELAERRRHAAVSFYEDLLAETRASVEGGAALLEEIVE